MAKILILQFNNRDDNIKVKLGNNLEIRTGKQLYDYLSTSIDGLGDHDFEIELVNDLGKFTKCHGTSFIEWKTNFLIVLVLDVRIPSKDRPYLTIGGRAFEIVHGLPLIDVNENVSVIYIQVVDQHLFAYF